MASARLAYPMNLAVGSGVRMIPRCPVDVDQGTTCFLDFCSSPLSNINKALKSSSFTDIQQNMGRIFVGALDYGEANQTRAVVK